ncbi:MAG: hypothetical protein K6E56_02355 [Lachnospiraceae bacterium]|nr:hypothetical protein [Lachnospiraceae bacterium]
MLRTLKKKIDHFVLFVEFSLKNALSDERGIGTVEMILILVVLIGLVLIFKDSLTELVGDIFETITDQAGEV